MKLFQNEHVFDYPWEHVASGHWNKYPNPFNPAVEATDILERTVSGSGILKTVRLLSGNLNMPKWAKRMTGLSHAVAVEHSEVDPELRELRMRSCNFTGSDIFTVEESIVYKPHPTDANKTLMTHTAEVHVPSMSFAEKPIKDNIAKNAHKGLEAMAWTIENLPSDFKMHIGSPAQSRKSMPA